MDMMKEALRRKMMEMKGEKGPDALMAQDDQEKEGSDLAPKIEASAEGGEVEAEIPPEMLEQILMALADHQPGAGREPNGLQERAALGAKGKLAAMKEKA